MNETINKKKVVFSMGGKGGVGKTTLMTSLVEWYQGKGLPCSILDFDTETKNKGSLHHFFPETSVKIELNGEGGIEGLDTIIDRLDEVPVVIADMGASSGEVTYNWFNSMYDGLRDLDIEFIAVGMITSDPASAESVLQWASILQERVKYLIVLNEGESQQKAFEFWDVSEQAKAFKEAFKPEIISMESRIPAIQNLLRGHGLTLGAVSSRTNHGVPELSKTSAVIRAQAYRRKLNAEFERTSLLS